MLNLISLGAGVQSSTMALMAAAGELTPMPDGAIFADTQAEPQSVYRWLDWLEAQLPFPVYRVSAGDLAAAEVEVRRSRKSGKVYRRGMIPAFGLHPTTGKRGLFSRRCTRDYKVDMILRKARQLAGVPRTGREGVYVQQWIGISTDEAHRMKDSRFPWTTHWYPLIDAGMSRADCLRWMAERGHPQPPRSACVFCPYHSDAEWYRLKTEEPEAFARAVAVEEAMQAAARLDEVAEQVPYLHEDRVPLRLVVLDPEKRTRSGFGNECEGMCGV